MMNYEALLEKLSKELPKFPDGRIDYADCKEAAVLDCFIEFDGKILLLKRSDKVHSYKGKWMVVGGFIDELRPLKAKVLEELKEELQISEENIQKIEFYNQIDFYDKKINILWHIFPVLVNLKREPKIVLDWEHTDFKWINPAEIANYDTVPNLDQVLTIIK